MNEKPPPDNIPLGIVNSSWASKLAKFDRWWFLVIIIVLLLIFMIVTKPDPYMDILLFMTDIENNFGLSFNNGILVTVFTTLVSFILILITGLITALMRLSKSWILSGIATIYVEIIRGIPLLVQLLFWYFAVPSILQDLGNRFNLEGLKYYQANAIMMAVVGLTFCYAAYMSEVYRAGIQSIPKGQMEAARSLGMTYYQAMRHVILPQAVRVILPPVGNDFISLLKDSSLVSIVAVADMTRRGREFMSKHFNPIETWTMVALLYLVMTLLTARLVAYIERKTKMEK